MIFFSFKWVFCVKTENIWGLFWYLGVWPARALFNSVSTGLGSKENKLKNPSKIERKKKKLVQDTKIKESQLQIPSSSETHQY